MNTLQNLYEKPPIMNNIIPRKIKILNKKVIITGSFKCGITSLILEFLSNFKKNEFLYIDLNDKRIHDILNLNLFVQTNNIKILIIENFNDEFELPNIENIILTNKLKFKKTNFKNIVLQNIDYEEFLAFYNKTLSVKQSFDIFAKMGNKPKCANLTRFEQREFIKSNLYFSLKDNLSYEVFAYITKFQSSLVSINQIYHEIKSFSKISKDKLYKIIQNFENLNLIYLLPKYNCTSTKKLFFTDFSVKSIFSFDKDFLKLFSNIVFCELMKKDELIFYHEKIDFYIPSLNQAYICLPFLPPEFMQRKFISILKKLKELNVKNLYIITLGNEMNVTKDEINAKAISFWDWALAL